MPLTKISTAVYLLPGMVAKIKAPTYYVEAGIKPIENENGEQEEKTLTQGFALQDDDVGTLVSPFFAADIMFANSLLTSLAALFSLALSSGLFMSAISALTFTTEDSHALAAPKLARPTLLG